MASASSAETFTKVVAPALGLVLSNAMFMAPLSVRGGPLTAARAPWFARSRVRVRAAARARACAYAAVATPCAQRARSAA